MARIAGVDLPRDKKIQYALPYIFGIGPSNSVRILAETGISPDARVRDLRDAEVARLRQVIERDYKVEGALRTEVAMNIKRLMDIGTYRGGRKETGRKETGRKETGTSTCGRCQTRQEGRRGRGHRARHRDVQQYAHHDHRPAGQRDHVGLVGESGLQGFQEVDALRGDRGSRAGGARSTEPRCKARARARAGSRFRP